MMTMIPILKTSFGKLYQTDCVDWLKDIADDSVDLVFADPPFNLGKQYSSNINDSLTDCEYIEWCKEWATELARVLKPGGSLFVWNLPKWNVYISAHLNNILNFRHWIAVDLKYSLPIASRLYPSHYSLLYYIKGEKPAIFNPDRLPISCCRHCGGEIKDYGGYKNKLNPQGISLTDIWTDIPPVRHAKYKHREENQLPLKLMDRIITLASNKGSIVLDPFGGSGTTFVVAELLERNWLGSELDCSAILERFQSLDNDRDLLDVLQTQKNRLFTKVDLEKRRKNGTPLSKAYRFSEQECECSLLVK